MYVDPDVKAVLDGADPSAKDFCDLTPEEARRAMDDMVTGMLAPVYVARVEDLVIPTPDHNVSARLYCADPSNPGALVVYMHGGGWEIGSIENTDRPVRRLAADTGMSILSIDYRLAPEHPFPAGLDDCYAATVWAAEHADELDSDGSFFAVAGDSSGGNLAAAVAQLARDRGGPRIDHQLLVYPVVSRNFESTSYGQFAEGYFLTRKTMQHFWQMYVGDGVAPPYADLLAVEDLTGLPPATVITCGLDPLSSEGQIYSQRLAEAGVEVTALHAHGLLHGIWFMDATGRRAYQFGLDIAGALRRAAADATISTRFSPSI